MGKRGLYPKYAVRKASTGEMVEDCFVLRPDRDEAARAALRCYASETDNVELALDIIEWLDATRDYEANNDHD